MAGYGSDEGLAAWLTENGYALPDDAPAPEVLRQRGSVYIDGLYGLRFAGTAAGGYSQDRAWPRTGAKDYWGSPIPADQIPTAIIDASYAAAYQEAVSPGSLSVTATAGAQIKREKTDVLETEYFEGAAGDALANATPQLSAVDGLLAPFLTPCGFPMVMVV